MKLFPTLASMMTSALSMRLCILLPVLVDGLCIRATGKLLIVGTSSQKQYALRWWISTSCTPTHLSGFISVYYVGVSFMFDIFTLEISLCISSFFSSAIRGARSKIYPGSFGISGGM